MAAVETTLMLGEDHVRYGTYACRVLDEGRVAAAIGVGARPDVPSAAFKREPNEDGLLAVVRGPHLLLAVADAHHGSEASHDLLRALAARLDPRVASLTALGQALDALAGPAASAETLSATTLLVAAFDRRARRGFGLSFGDSSLVLLRPAAAPRRLNRPNPSFVRLDRPGSLARERAHAFRFTATAGALLLAYTDGVDGCHYGHPETSVRPADLEALYADLGPAPEPYARRLAEMALAGVDGNPGGEDNVAIVVAAT